MKSEKLVRDRVPDIIREKGETAEVRVANEQEYRKRLWAKLDEEIKEFRQSKNEEELADVQEVLQAIAKAEKISWKAMKEKQKEKAKEKGGFRKRFIWKDTHAAK